MKKALPRYIIEIHDNKRGRSQTVGIEDLRDLLRRNPITKQTPIDRMIDDQLADERRHPSGDSTNVV